jgi:hypothetical protein
MPPSLAPKRQEDNYKINYNTICKKHLQNQRKQENKKTKGKINNELKYRK